MHMPMCAKARSGLSMKSCLAILPIRLAAEQEMKPAQTPPVRAIKKSHLINEEKINNDVISFYKNI